MSSNVMLFRPCLRPAALACAVLLSLPASALIAPLTASAAPAVTCTRDASSGDDLDGDTYADPVVGLPNLGDGAVDVHFTQWAALRLRESDLGVTDPSGRFGAAATTGHANDDVCADLVVSAPGTGGVGGSVYVIPGSDAGLEPAAAVRLRAPSGVGGSWGAALALMPAGGTVLAVGAPTSTLSAGGEVYLYVLGTDASPTGQVVVSQGANGVAGASEAGDRFGAVLSGWRGALAVGAPGESVGSRKEAGAVTVLTLTVPTTFTAFTFTQDSAKVPGRAEAGDLFGAALAAGHLHRPNTVWAVGAPGETVGRARHTGVVDVVELSPPDDTGRTQVVGVEAWTQDSARVPGKNESGDRWGWSVAFNSSLEDEFLWVGAPYEDNGKARDSGSVTTISVQFPCTGFRFRQGLAPVGGKAETGDHLGWTLAATTGRDEEEEDTIDGMLVGAPGEDLVHASDAGYTYLLEIHACRRADLTPVLPVGGPKANLAYGEVLGS